MSSLGKRRNSSWLLLVVTYDSVLDVTENVLDHAANGRGLLLSDFLSKALSLDVCSLSPEDYSGRRYDSFLSDLGCHYFFFEDRSTHLLRYNGLLCHLLDNRSSLFLSDNLPVLLVDHWQVLLMDHFLV